MVHTSSGWSGEQPPSAPLIAKKEGMSKAEAYERMESNPRFGRLVEEYYATA